MSRIKRAAAAILLAGTATTGVLALGAGSASASTTNWLVQSYHYNGAWGSPVQWQVDQAWQLCQAEVNNQREMEFNREAAGGRGQYGFWCADGGTNADGSGKVNEWESYTP
ncbi:hypothetical protein ABZV34_07205 [Streptomyces sp. NPDC005195]|uniref:hypothetical protein n=1 Tax=Streptomyces sp. NPDC005195 TaxID=3154561 RepID=UPI0033BCBF15